MNILNEFEKTICSNSESAYYYSIENEIAEIKSILKKVRIEKNISQNQIAKKTGISKQMISKLECYNGNPTLSVFVKYCDSIGVDLFDAIKQYLNANDENTI